MGNWNDTSRYRSCLRTASSGKSTSRVFGGTHDVGHQRDLRVTIVSVEEQMRGWLATIAKELQIDRQVKPYFELGRMFEFFQAFVVKPFDQSAASKFAELRASKIRVASMDLKIASIAISSNCLLLTANKRDFEKVPGLRFEN